MKENKSKENRDYWKIEEENIIKEWCDKAMCYQWLHSRCREIYQIKNAWYTIPVIIISTVTGTANFAQERFSDDAKPYVAMAIGTLSIIAGIITTIYQFLQISELNEGYRASSISWNKLHNNLKTLLTRHPLDRIEPSQALKIYKDEYDHLCEISPPIIRKVIKEFNKKFKQNNNLTKPEICNKLESTNIYKMSDIERENMKNILNNKKKNPKLMETFFSLNGRNATEEELEMLQGNIDFKYNINDTFEENLNDKSNSNDNSNDDSNDDSNDNNSNSININISDKVSEI